MLDIVPRTRPLNPECEFFVPGNFERYSSFRKLTPRADEFEPLVYGQPIVCGEPGCKQAFQSLLKYEEHKFRAHYHRCAACGKSYPSDRLLSIHISELHDSYFAAMSKRKPSYCCLVVGCDQLFWNNTERRQHLVKEHKYHPSYDFHNPKRYLQRSKRQSEGTPCAEKKNDSAMSVCGGSAPSIDSARTSAAQMVAIPHTDTVTATAGTGGNRAQRRAEKRMQLTSFGLAPTSGGCSADTGRVDSTADMGGIEQSSDRGRSQTGSDELDASGATCTEDSLMVDQAGEAAVDELTAGMGRISVKVPSKISFGHRRRHGYS